MKKTSNDELVLMYAIFATVFLLILITGCCWWRKCCCFRSKFEYEKLSHSEETIGPRQRGFFNVTPLVDATQCYGNHLSVLFKLESFQPSGSFKDRGLGNFINNLLATSADKNETISKFVIASGGNAGFAVALIGQKCGIPVEVFVPTSMPRMMESKLKSAGAAVCVGGNSWNTADAMARDAVSRDGQARYIPPFDHPLVWEGNSTVMQEIAEQLQMRHQQNSINRNIVGSSADDDLYRPDVIVLTVGGGGLLRGVQLALEELGWLDVRIVAVETEGADSFHAAKIAGKPVNVGRCSSVATSLGALEVIAPVLTSPISTTSLLVSDTEAVRAVLDFANSERVFVEPGCGAGFSVLANGGEKIFSALDIDPATLPRPLKVVCIACGGNLVNLDLISEWKLKFGI